MVSNLKPCPCGKIPVVLCITDAGQGRKWANASCNYCGEWTIEFRTEYNDLDSPECLDFAVSAWNNAPRSTKITDND